MNKSFKGNYTPFYIKLIKRLAPLLLIAILAYFQINYGKLSKGELANYKIHWLVFFIICFIIGIYHHVDKTRTAVKEICFHENHLQIIGYDFSSKFDIKFNLDKLMIEIQEEELGKNNIRYCLEIYFDDKYYYLNKFNDWDYQTLAQIVDEYKLRTEKSISGSEYYPKLIEGKNQ